MKLSLLITFYNEEEMIQKTHEKMTAQLEQLVGSYLDDYELLYINDGSTDKTFQLMKGIAERNHHVKYISLSRNFGREGGILAGFKYATGDAVMVMDGDLQHPPSLIPIFLDAYFEGYDLVSGQRDRVGESKLGSLFAKLFYQISNRFMDVKLTDGKSELKLLSRRAVETFIALPEYNRFNKGLYEWIGFKEKVIPYKNQIREVGVSKFGFRKSFNYAIQGIISFNDKPLRICIQLGGLSIVLALIYLATEFFKYLSNVEGYVSGYFTTIAAIILFGGVELAETVVATIDNQAANYQRLYKAEDSLEEKVTKIVTQIYGGTGVVFEKKARNQLAEFAKNGWDKLPVCMAKTQYSFSDDQFALGAPTGFDITVREFVPKLGAGFIVALTGDVMTMPGLPKAPTALNMDVAADGTAIGLF